MVPPSAAPVWYTLNEPEGFVLPLFLPGLFFVAVIAIALIVIRRRK